jgi:hypothetical protein
VASGCPGVSCRRRLGQAGARLSCFEGTEGVRTFPLVLLGSPGVAPVPRHRTSVIALLDWLRVSPAFSMVVLKDFTEDAFRVQVFGVFSAQFATRFENAARKALDPDDGGLDEQRRLVLRDALQRRVRRLLHCR